MVLGVYLAGIVLFVMAFSFTRLSSSFGQVMAIVQQAIRVIMDSQLDDHEKERAARHAALQLLKQAVLIILKGAITVICALLPFWLADVLALQPWDETMAFALRWDVLLITTVLMLAGWLFCRRWSSADP